MSHVLAKELKLSVFQAAFSGLLTKSLDTDTDVFDYLVSLKEERINYEKKYKDKKHKSFWESEIEFEPLFDIPEKWTWAFVGDLFRHNAGKALNSKNTKGTKRPYLTTSNVYSDHFKLNNLKEMYFTDEEADKCCVKKGDLLVLEGGDCGRTALWNLDESYCIQNHLHRLRPFGTCDIKYFYYLLSFYKESGYMRGKGIAIQGLSANALHNIVIPVCSPEEQTRIVTKVDELMTKIDEYEKLENELAQIKKNFPGDMKASVLQAAMEGKLTEQLNTDSSVFNYVEDVIKLKKDLIKNKVIKKDKTNDHFDCDDIPFDIPNNWMWVKFGNIANLKTGKTPPRAKPNWWGNSNDIPWVSISDMIGDSTILKTKEFISTEGIEEIFKSSISPKGTMIMSFKLTVGRVSILGMDAVHNEAIISIFPYKDNNNILQKYLFKVLPYLVQYGDSKNAIKGETLNQDSLCNLLIPLPPIEEQQLIVEKLDKLLPLCDALCE